MICMIGNCNPVWENGNCCGRLDVVHRLYIIIQRRWTMPINGNAVSYGILFQLDFVVRILILIIIIIIITIALLPDIPMNVNLVVCTGIIIGTSTRMIKMFVPSFCRSLFTSSSFKVCHTSDIDTRTGYRYPPSFPDRCSLIYLQLHNDNELYIKCFDQKGLFQQ